MFHKQYKESLCQVVFDEMQKVYQSFDQGVNNIIHQMKTQTFCFQSGMPQYLYVDGQETQIKEVLKEYYDTGVGLEATVDKIEKIFYPKLEETISCGLLDIAIKAENRFQSGFIDSSKTDELCCGDPNSCGKKPCSILLESISDDPDSNLNDWVPNAFGSALIYEIIENPYRTYPVILTYQKRLLT